MDASSARSPEKAAAALCPGPSAACGPLPYPPGSACPGGGEGLLAWSLSLWGAQGRVGMSWAWAPAAPGWQETRGGQPIEGHGGDARWLGRAPGKAWKRRVGEARRAGTCFRSSRGEGAVEVAPARGRGVRASASHTGLLLPWASWEGHAAGPSRCLPAPMQETALWMSRPAMPLCPLLGSSSSCPTPPPPGSLPDLCSLPGSPGPSTPTRQAPSHLPLG